MSPDKFLEDLRDNKHLYHQYFGVRLSDIVRVKMDVPKEVEQSESTYVSHLLDAYSESGEIDGLQSVANSRFSDHFTRARKTFWIAESLRKISEDNSQEKPMNSPTSWKTWSFMLQMYMRKIIPPG